MLLVWISKSPPSVLQVPRLRVTGELDNAGLELGGTVVSLN